MKFSLLALCSVLFMTACSSMRVTHTEVATGAAHPKAIYIRPFSVDHAVFIDPRNPNSEEIRKSLAPIEFAHILRDELSKIAPTRVLKPDEEAPTGWLIEGAFDYVDAGMSGGRPNTLRGNRAGETRLKLHVRVIEVEGERPVADTKEGVSPSKGFPTRYGHVIYAFDVEGFGPSSTQHDRIRSEYIGGSLPIEYRRAAERIMLALSPDPFRYGHRSSPRARN